MDILYEQREGNGIHPSFWNNDIGIALGGLYEVTVHWLDCSKVLLEYRVHITPSLLDISY